MESKVVQITAIRRKKRTEGKKMFIFIFMLIGYFYCEFYWEVMSVRLNDFDLKNLLWTNIINYVCLIDSVYPSIDMFVINLKIWPSISKLKCKKHF